MELIADAVAFDGFKADWTRLVDELTYFYPGFDETRYRLAQSNGDFWVVGDKDESGRLVRGACFSSRAARQNFNVGRRKLFSLPVRMLSKVGFEGLGRWTSEQWADALETVLRQRPFTVFDLGEVPIGSPLHHATKQLPRGFMVGRSARKSSIRWFIDLPESFSEYLAGMRASTRRSLAYKIRRFERDLSFELVKITSATDTGRFLEHGEIISRKTYQWKIGQRLENDQITIDLYNRLAARGAVHCYLLYIEGVPAAFLRGELQNGVYNYETPGFDPRFDKHSPGQVLLAWAIRDLIENTDCRIFDFGEGGDRHGYKSRFGNRSVECDPLQLFQLRRPYSLFVHSVLKATLIAKDLGARLSGHDVDVKEPNQASPQ
ncbi:MAG: GNAT family N-acetyltransferase [Novosphingobium sp.]|nr:GNAT family N-acetyltransferase [Novosphingobium sp.]